jgi:putative ABC transport system permease protein
MMLLWENMKLAFSAIRINKMRSFLTMLGIIIGIAAVISIVSIGDTMRGVIADQFAGIGVNRVDVYLQSDDDTYDDSDLFSGDDIDKIRDTFGSNIEYLSGASNQKAVLIRNRTSENVIFNPVREGYTKVQPVDVVQGRMIDGKDNDGEKKNVVLEEKTAMKLFKTTNIVGKKVKVSYDSSSGSEVSEFNIVGVYRNSQTPLGKLLSGGSTEKAYIPESLVFNSDSEAFDLDMFVSPDANAQQFEKIFTGYVARLKNKNISNVVYYTAKSDMQSIDSIMSKLSAAVGAIAAISLLVGGIGIMNIMLVSVTERTREIGIRKALGARTIDILVQFLTESAIISAAGGVIGTSIGVGVVMIGGAVFGIRVIVNPITVIVAVCFSAAVGIFFGMFPARKAAKADPITALRYE